MFPFLFKSQQNDRLGEVVWIKILNCYLHKHVLDQMAKLVTVGKQSQRIETKPLRSKDHIFKDHSSDFLLFIDYSLFVFNDAFL